MRVDLGRRKGRVSEHLLYGVDIGALREQFGGNAVPQNVRRLPAPCRRQIAQLLADRPFNEHRIKLQSLLAITIGQEHPCYTREIPNLSET